jgi:hypothetical protein
MAAKTIVTFHPDVACDLCGRRLLRGERPDVFLGGGQRRMVCELCAPRANHEGWRREVEEQLGSPHIQQPQRGRSLLGRLRQRREPVRAPSGGADIADPLLGRAARTPGAAPGVEWAGVESEWTGAADEWANVPGSAPASGERAGSADGYRTEFELAPVEVSTDAGVSAAAPVDLDADADGRRALEVFNAGELPQRVAGVTRSLGAACVRVTPLADTAGKVAIVVAWELCWYRYEIDLEDEVGGVRVAAEGMELEELADEERVANAAADERGLLSLLAD